MHSVHVPRTSPQMTFRVLLRLLTPFIIVLHTFKFELLFFMSEVTLEEKWASKKYSLLNLATCWPSCTLRPPYFRSKRSRNRESYIVCFVVLSPVFNHRRGKPRCQAKPVDEWNCSAKNNVLYNRRITLDLVPCHTLFSWYIPSKFLSFLTQCTAWAKAGH